MDKLPTVNVWESDVTAREPAASSLAGPGSEGAACGSRAEQPAEIKTTGGVQPKVADLQERGVCVSQR